MSKLYKYIFIIMLSGVLLGCEDKTKNFSYYMQNPAVLKDKVKECQIAMHLSQEDKTQCEMILYAAASIMNLIEEQQENPEKFGQRVLDAQIAYEKSQALLIKSQQVLADLKAKNASSAELRTAQDDVYKAQQACKTQQESIKVYLAVLGLSSPE